jgi:hypothetical protein
MAIIAGARTFHQVRATVKAGFWPVMRVSWITSPICLAFAQKFLPEQTWVPFFNIVAFIIGSKSPVRSLGISADISKPTSTQRPRRRGLQLSDASTTARAVQVEGTLAVDLRIIRHPDQTIELAIASSIEQTRSSQHGHSWILEGNLMGFLACRTNADHT